MKDKKLKLRDLHVSHTQNVADLVYDCAAENEATILNDNVQIPEDPGALIDI
jgi:hypothetical protein